MTSLPEGLRAKLVARALALVAPDFVEFYELTVGADGEIVAERLVDQRSHP